MLLTAVGSVFFMLLGVCGLSVFENHLFKMSEKRTAKSIFMDFGKGCSSGQVFAREVSMSYVVMFRIQNFKITCNNVTLLVCQ